MNYDEILNSVKSLPANEQFFLASSIFDELAQHSEVALSDAMKQLLDERAKEADEHPECLIPAAQVFATIRADLKKV